MLRTSCSRFGFSNLISHASFFLTLMAFVAVGSVAVAQDCPEEDPLLNYTGTVAIVCPCFVPGEQAGAVLDAPADHYPIEILRIGIGWASQFGGSPQSLEQGIHVYGSGLPNPGSPIFTLAGPVLNDGYINVFDLEPIPGEVLVSSGPFTVTLEFLNSNSGDIFAPSMYHDGNGCQSAKNVVYAIPGGWFDACVLGITGDWVVFAVYRQVNCTSGVDEEFVVSSQPAVLMRPEPNPFSDATRFEFILTSHEHVDLAVYDVRGQRVAVLIDETFPPGRHTVVWSGERADGAPVASGIYFATMRAGGARSTQQIVLTR